MPRVFAIYRDAVADLPAAAWIQSAALLVNRAGTMVLPFLALYFTKDRGYDVSTTGWLVALYGVGAMAGSFVGGFLADRIGPVPTQKISLVLSGALFLVIPRASSIGALAVAMLLISVVAESFRPAVMTAVAHSVDAPLRPRAFGLLRQAVNLGMAIGPALGGVLAEIDFEWLFICEAITCWAAAVVLQAAGRALRAPGEDGPAEARAAPAPGRSPWRDGPYLVLIAIVTVFVTAFFQLWTTVPLYYQGFYGLSEGWIGSLFAFNALLILLFELPAIRAIEHRARMPVVGLGALLICAGLAILPLGTSLAWAALSVAIWSAGEMIALPMLNVVVAERAGPGRTGAYMGVFMLSFSIAFVLAPLSGTAVFDLLGPDALWYGIGFLGLPVLIATLALGRRFALPSSSPGSA